MVKRKSGSTHIDWVISLGIFLFYLVWFFVFIKPQITSTVELSPISNSLNNYITENTYSNSINQPLMMNYNDLTTELIMVNFTPVYGLDTFNFNNKPYYISKNNKLYFLKEFNKTKEVIYINEINSTQKRLKQSADIIVGINKISNSNGLLVEIINNITESVVYQDRSIISNIHVSLENDNLKITNTSTEYNGVYYKINSATQRVNFSFVFFAKSQLLVFESEKNNKNSNKRVKIDMSLSKFDNYSFENGEINIITPNSSCVNKESNELKIYNNQQTLIFKSFDNLSFKQCFDNSNINLSITLANKDKTELFIIISNNNSYDYFSAYNYKMGLKTKSEGIDINKFNNLNQTLIRNLLGIPIERGFSIILWNNSINSLTRSDKLSQIGNETLTDKEIKNDEHIDYLLNDDGSKQEITRSIITW